jgi:hypothetical protein
LLADDTRKDIEGRQSRLVTGNDDKLDDLSQIRNLEKQLELIEEVLIKDYSEKKYW